jgi:hypothetical protein
VIDAHLQQARALPISHCLSSSSRLISSEVAYAFTHDLFVLDLEVSIRHRRCVPLGFSCVVPITTLSTTQDTFVLNLVLEPATLGKTSICAVLATAAARRDPYVRWHVIACERNVGVSGCYGANR